MKWDEIGDLRCSVARSLSVIGDRWTLLIVRDVFHGIRRFEDLQRSLGLTRHLLSHRLRKLEEHGVLLRVRYLERPARYEYRLTPKGVDLHPVLLALVRWGDQWMADDDGPPMAVVHRTCGHSIVPELQCPDCGEALKAPDIRVERR